MFKKTTLKSQSTCILGKPLAELKEYYIMGKELGKGQFGITHLAKDRRTGEEVAIKSIAKRSIQCKEEIEDIRREVAVMEHLAGHPNIVTLNGTIEDKTHVHLILELCAGGELFDRISARGHFSERTAAQLMSTIVSVVAHFHQSHVIHRDLKPENFLLASRREDAPLKVTDFGLSVFFKEGEVFHGCQGSPYYVAPEVVKGKYGKECDVWSCGVILYILLAGRFPFKGDTDKQIFSSVLKAKPDLETEPWPRISRSAKDLIRSMLTVDCSRRITAADALKHPWLSGKEVSDAPLGNEMLRRLKNFCSANKMKKLALKVIACSLSREEISQLKKIFKEMDKDGSGAITFPELKAGMRKLGATMPEDQLQRIMDAADVDNSGTIDYTEFITATMHMNRAAKEEHIWAAFQHFDQDGSGYITVSELREALAAENMLEPGEVERILAEVDTDGNGMIDYEEFSAMMRR